MMKLNVKQQLKQDADLKLILVRGVSGSGKTTYAENFLRENPLFSHYEADMFFYKNGKYQFDPAKLKLAHQWCFDKTEKDLQNNKSVIVSNTFTQKWELEPYIKLAEKYKSKLLIKKAVGNFKNIHGVPESSLKSMKSRWENVKSETTI